MIYEVRTYDIKPRNIPEVEKRFGESYEKRKAYSELAAFFHTEIGPLNQIIHIWPYKDLEERAKIRAAAVKDKVWPPNTGEFITKMQSDIFIPFDFAPPFPKGKLGPFFEWRTYTYLPGQLPVILDTWKNALDVRLQFGPVVALWYSELGGLNKFVHIWPYASLNERMETRNKAHATGMWPPGVKAQKEGRKGYDLSLQENKIVMPAAFSPLQ